MGDAAENFSAADNSTRRPAQIRRGRRAGRRERLWHVEIFICYLLFAICHTLASGEGNVRHGSILP
jgi:hypothetical protein